MTVPDRIVIGFFTAVVASEGAAIVALWMKCNSLQDQIFNLLQK